MLYQSTRPHQKAIQTIVRVEFLHLIEYSANHIVPTGSLTSTQNNTYIHCLVVCLITGNKLNQRHSVCVRE